jgi:hypothetical protein
MTDSDANVRQANVRPTEQSRGENVFQVLANNARRRTLGELRTTAIGCTINAAYLWWRHPSLSWLAAGLAACSCYAVWGLLDRSAADAEERGFAAGRTVDVRRDVQPIVTVLGTAAAFWSLFSFMAAALGGWQH